MLMPPLPLLQDRVNYTVRASMFFYKEDPELEKVRRKVWGQCRSSVEECTYVDRQLT